MAQDTVTQAKGLVTQYNPLAVQPGVLIQADDCVIRRENTIEDRRGYAEYGTLSSAPSQLFTYSGRVLSHNGTTLSYDNGSGTFTAFSGSYSPPSSHKIRGIEALQNLYFTTSEGVKVATGLSASSIRASGAPRSLNPSVSLTGSTGFMSTGKNVAYRIVIKRIDANNNTVFGYPSQREWIYNGSGGSRNVTVTVYFPSEVTTSDIIQVYRTEQTTSTGSDTAGDEMGLIYQVNPTSSDVTAGYLTFTDSIDDALRGATLYTSPSQEGIVQANDRPPLCKDLALFKDYLFFANTETRHRLNVSLVGTASLSGKTITLAGVTYNFGATEITSGAGSPQAKVYSSGIAATDIENTARSLVNVINRYASNTLVYAYYVSGPEELPGQILIEARNVGGSSFTVAASDSAISSMFFPAPPTTGTNAQSTSSNQVQKNGLFFSKAQQAEHVPPTNYVPVGPANAEILRVVTLRDSLIIISEAGVYRLAGETPQNFSVQPVDLTVFCKAKDSVAALANQVFMLSNQGIVAISDTGVQVVSREIEPEITPLIAYSNLASNTYGVAYESERSYLLSTVSSTADTEPTQIFVFNAFTRAWTRWTFGFTSGVVENDADKFYFSKGVNAKVYRERKDFSDSDYADPEKPITITAISGDTVTFTAVALEPLPGWLIKVGASALPIKSLESTGVNTYQAVMTIPPPASWSVGAGDLVPSVGMQIKWDVWTAGQPGLMKQVREVKILADMLTGNSTVTAFDISFETDIDPDQERVQITSSAARWGSRAWGLFPWGGSSDSYAYPTYVPMNKQYCRALTLGVLHNTANEKLSISGYSLTFNLISERTGR